MAFRSVVLCKSATDQTCYAYLLYVSLQAVVTELPSMSRADRENSVQVLFETLHVSKLALVHQANLTLHTYGQNTGVVVDVGHECIGA